MNVYNTGNNKSRKKDIRNKSIFFIQTVDIIFIHILNDDGCVFNEHYSY